MTIKINGDFKFVEKLRDKLARLSDGQTLALSKAMAEKAVDLVRQGFAEQVAPDGTAWAPLKRQRARQGKRKASDRILQDTGRMRNSFAVRAVSAEGFTVGTDVEYAAHHQFGTKGRTKAYSRSQAVNKRGKFMKHAKAAKQKRGAVGFRILNFQAGGGKIPARPMLPEGELPERWQKPLERTATTFLKKALEPK